MHGRDCLECRGQGRHIRCACPLCGDPGWDHVNGRDDRDGMACRISCGYRSTADDPGWRAQVLPGPAERYEDRGSSRAKAAITDRSAQSSLGLGF